jgi:16S rRNA (cytosine967-C5)-methyltransferase
VLALARDGLFPADFETIAAAVQAIGPPSGTVSEALGTPGWPGADAWPSDPLDRMAAELSLPRWIAERLLAERGEAEARALGEALLHPAPVDLRVQLRRISRDEARRSLEEETGAEIELTPWSPAGLRLARRKNLSSTRASREGWIQVEDEGSQVAVRALDAPPGASVIDACAGAGGKTLALADIVLGEKAGSITACDVHEGRLEELARRARDAGVLGRIRIAPIPPGGPLPGKPRPADLVLVDAPCSGLGTLRRNPELKLRWTPGDIPRFAALQASILERFLPLVRPGGRLAYVTCSILAEENEDVARGFERAHPDLVRHEPRWAMENLPSACVRDRAVRIDPATAGTDGFFVVSWVLPG